MAMKNCPSCGGSGVNNTSISKGLSSNLCGGCGGSGQVQDYSGGGGSACFPAATRVRTPAGHVPIDRLNRGDRVIAIDRHGHPVIRRVATRNSYADQPVSAIHFEDGSRLLATDHHTVQSADGWMRVRDIGVGHRLVQGSTTAAPSFRRVSRVDRCVSVETVHNLVIEGECTFIADGIVAHSFTNLRRIRSALHRVRFAVRETFDSGLIPSSPEASIVS